MDKDGNKTATEMALAAGKSISDVLHEKDAEIAHLRELLAKAKLDHENLRRSNFTIYKVLKRNESYDEDLMIVEVNGTEAGLVVIVA